MQSTPNKLDYTEILRYPFEGRYPTRGHENRKYNTMSGNTLNYTEIDANTLIRPVIRTVDRIGTPENPLGYAEKEKPTDAEKGKKEERRGNIPPIKVPKWKKVMSMFFRMMCMF